MRMHLATASPQRHQENDLPIDIGGAVAGHDTSQYDINFNPNLDVQIAGR